MINVEIFNIGGKLSIKVEFVSSDGSTSYDGFDSYYDKDSYWIILIYLSMYLKILNSPKSVVKIWWSDAIPLNTNVIIKRRFFSHWILC